MSVALVWSEAVSVTEAVARAAGALRQSRIPSLRKLRVEESSTCVTISGLVTSYYLKQLAQETVMPVLDHRELHNDVMVVGETVAPR